MASVREDIIAAFAARFSGTVIRGSVSNSADDAPIIGIIDGDDEALNIEAGSVNVIMTIRTEKLEAIDDITYANNSTQGNAMLAELITSGTGTDRTMGGLCSAIRYAVGGVDLGSVSSDIVGAFAEFSIAYKFDVGDPNTDSYFV